MIIGMDFGTTNTGAAAYDGEKIQLLPLDPSSPTPVTCRTALYITRGREYYLGSAALNTYFSQNVGRPSRFVKIKIGEIQQVFAELPTFYRDVFVYEDEFSPGRLFVSIKTALRNRNYFGTVYQNTWYSASDLVAIFLMGMKQRAEKNLDAPLNEVVLGRPVRFSNDAEEDRIAQARLLQAAFKAGFEKVYLEYEPVAAALAYEKTLQGKETILVFDFGGGTLDFTVIEVGGSSERRVLATGGIPIAGDVFDQRLFRATIPKHLGENDAFITRGKRYPIPAHIFDQLSTPHEILGLNTPQNLEMLQGIHQGAIHKEKTQALLEIVSSNYALLLFDLIERTKRRLSEKLYASLSFEAGNISLHETILRSRFEQAIHADYAAIRFELEETLKRSGVNPRDIDRVIRTGGSSQIPLFVEMLEGMFGAEKVRGIDVFTSVTSGLAIRGYEIAHGDASLPAYTPATIDSREEIAGTLAQENSPLEVDLGAVGQRFAVREKDQGGEASLPVAVLAVLQTGSLSIHTARDLGGAIGSGRFALFTSMNEQIEGKATYACLEEHILLATNLFKFISLPVRSLVLAQQAGETAVGDLLPLDAGESVCALAAWQPERARGQLVLVTNVGQVRIFDAALFASQLAKKPYFQSEHKYNGLPAFLLFTDNATTNGGQNSRILVGTNLGRVGAGNGREIGVSAREMLKARSDELVTAAQVFSEGDAVVALDEQGRLLPVRTTELLAGEGSTARRPLTLRRNFSIAVLAAFDGDEPKPAWVLTSQGAALPLAAITFSEIETWDRPRRALRLKPGEKVLHLLP